MKYIPNSLSIVRIFLALLLPFFSYQKKIFFIIYIFCGLTDILDGYLARKFHVESLFGSKLDSIGDTVMFMTIAYLIVVNEYDLLKSFIPILILLVIIKSANFIIAYFKQKTFFSIHTWANKFAGFLIFFIPLSVNNNVIITFTCIVALYAAMEEFLIHVFLSNTDSNRKSLFF